VEEGRPNTTFAMAKSDAFFERPENRVRTQGSQLALIDGDHSLAKALQNFENLEALAAPNSVIAIHDVVPMTWMPEPQRRRPRQRSIPATWRLMKMLTEGRLADSE
jgi:predicted O-methyltransferase YrrM